MTITVEQDIKRATNAVADYITTSILSQPLTFEDLKCIFGDVINTDCWYYRCDVSYQMFQSCCP